jgi:hypothetical protein
MSNMQNLNRIENAKIDPKTPADSVCGIMALPSDLRERKGDIAGIDARNATGIHQENRPKNGFALFSSGKRPTRHPHSAYRIQVLAFGNEISVAPPVPRIFQLHTIDVRPKPVSPIPFRFLPHVYDSPPAMHRPGLCSGNFARNREEHLDRIAGTHQPHRRKKNPSIREIFAASLERFLGTIRAGYPEPR